LRTPEALKVLSEKDVVPDDANPLITQLNFPLAQTESEFQAISVYHPDYGAAWRQRDFDVITSPDFKKSLEENHVILVQWRDLKKLLQ
jgi:hypothetical protein